MSTLPCRGSGTVRPLPGAQLSSAVHPAPTWSFAAVSGRLLCYTSTQEQEQNRKAEQRGKTDTRAGTRRKQAGLGPRWPGMTLTLSSPAAALVPVWAGAPPAGRVGAVSTAAGEQARTGRPQTRCTRQAVQACGWLLSKQLPAGTRRQLAKHRKGSHTAAPLLPQPGWRGWPVRSQRGQPGPGQPPRPAFHYTPCHSCHALQPPRPRFYLLLPRYCLSLPYSRSRLRDRLPRRR